MYYIFFVFFSFKKISDMQINLKLSKRSKSGSAKKLKKGLDTGLFYLYGSFLVALSENIVKSDSVL